MRGGLGRRRHASSVGARRERLFVMSLGLRHVRMRRGARRGQPVELGGDAGNGRQLGGIGRDGRARSEADIIMEARRRQVLCAMRRWRGEWVRSGAWDGLWRGERRGIALRVAVAELGEHARARGRHGCVLSVPHGQCRVASIFFGFPYATARNGAGRPE